MISIQITSEFEKWLESQTNKFRAQIEKRLAHIEQQGHFGHVRILEGTFAELKFNNGCRIYFIRTGPQAILLILGGNKNGQYQDIKKAKKILIVRTSN